VFHHADCTSSGDRLLDNQQTDAASVLPEDRAVMSASGAYYVAQRPPLFAEMHTVVSPHENQAKAP